MGRKAKGTVTYVEGKDGAMGHYKVRITCIDGSRPWIHLDPTPKSSKREAWAREKAAHYTERARREGLVAAPSTKRSKGSSKESGALSAEQWWDELFKMRTQRGDSSVATDRGRYRNHIKPVVDKPMGEVTKEDCEHLRDHLDEKIRTGSVAWKTAANIWTVWTTACRLSCSSKHRPLRVRKDNPALGVEAPDRGHRRGKTWLWPSEFIKLVSCEDVPLSWRRIYALAVYLYLRRSELVALEWDDLDLEQGVANVHRSVDVSGKSFKTTKSGHTRRFSIEPELMPLLRAMASEQGRCGRVAQPTHLDRWARTLRRHLKRAGIDRAELFASDATRMPMTFHDLKATAVTWMAIRGDAALKIMQRAAHRQFATTQVYLRSAEMVGDAIGTPFPPLPACLLAPAAAGIPSSKSSPSTQRAGIAQVQSGQGP